MAGELDQAGNRSEEDAGGRVGDDGVQPEAPENALGQLGDEDEQSGGKKRIFKHVGSPAARLTRASSRGVRRAGAARR